MNLHSYVSEKLMHHKEMKLNQMARQAWLWSHVNRTYFKSVLKRERVKIISVPVACCQFC